MQSVVTWAGVDVSAEELVAQRFRAGNTVDRTFSNDASGHADLVRWLGKHSRICLEATGVYHLPVALALRAAGVEVMVVNPRVAKDYARALSTRSKTDKVDASVLLDYARRMEFIAWEAPRPAVLELRELGRRLGELVKTATEEKNRLHARRASGLSDVVISDIREHIDHLQKRVQEIERAAVRVIVDDADLREQFEIVSNARGFGVRTAILLLTELAVLDSTMTTREVVAHAGLDPRVYESGSSVRKVVRISKVGNARIRWILYMNAMSAIRHDRGARLFFAQLVARGKKRMQALVAVMRKLLHGIWTVLQRRVPFDTSVLFAASLAKAECGHSAAADAQPQSGEDHPEGRSEAEELRQQLEPHPAKAKPARKRSTAA
jgi:transposase